MDIHVSCFRSVGTVELDNLHEKSWTLHLHWERSFEGEGTLRCLKPLVRQGVHKKNFGCNLLQKFYRDKLLQYALRKNMVENDVDDNEDSDDNVEKGILNIENIRTEKVFAKL